MVMADIRSISNECFQLFLASYFPSFILKLCLAGHNKLILSWPSTVWLSFGYIYRKALIRFLTCK